MDEAERKLRSMDAARFVTALSGYNLLTSSTSPSAGVIFFLLKPTAKRGDVKTIDGLIEKVKAKLGTIKEGNFFVFSYPTVPGFSNVEALDLVLQDQNGGELNKFSGVANTFIANLMKEKSIAVAFTTFKADYPQLQLEVNEQKASQLGVNVKDLLQTVQAYFGSTQAADFNRFGKYYKVVVSANIADKAIPTAIGDIYVKNKLGQMVPVNTLVKLTRVNGSETASRYNLFNSIEINVIPKSGFSSGDAIAAIQEAAKGKLPAGYTFEFTGQTREEIESGGQATWIFVLSLIFVYFLLAAQYESYILPLTVILSIPTGVLGVFLAIGLNGIENNIYVQVALIMLIGLLAKNAILIVEFAVQRRKAGESIVDAAIDASKARMRPILMTSMAFVFGLFPMSIATGPSAQGNHSISISAAGGMLSGVILGLFIIPVLFVVFQNLQEKVRRKKPAPVQSKSNLIITQL